MRLPTPAQFARSAWRKARSLLPGPTAGTLGYFTWRHPRVDGVLYANWGSRPYEYRWAAEVVTARGLDVLDVGVGLPSQHGW